MWAFNRGLPCCILASAQWVLGCLFLQFRCSFCALTRQVWSAHQELGIPGCVCRCEAGAVGGNQAQAALRSLQACGLPRADRKAHPRAAPGGPGGLSSCPDSPRSPFMLRPLHLRHVKTTCVRDFPAVRWLRLGAFTSGPRFSPWSGN